VSVLNVLYVSLVISKLIGCC